ncbi:hypothetical protein GLOIN_2v1791029 [Rhizophagus clarus]|uniref:Uncharacterized protein n=1 Tax=Rhizophagus clarus TaxID=94130 RepID=A0A8H3QRA0_9GLOM|nr:hypothetical protein GLOIN_2v1791029 [Rhizophagus clarus]
MLILAGIIINSDNLGTVAFEVSQLLLDESDDFNETTDVNEMINSLTKFPDLQYILNQKSISQKQFEKFDPFFISEGFLYSEVYKKLAAVLIIAGIKVYFLLVFNIINANVSNIHPLIPNVLFNHLF